MSFVVFKCVFTRESQARKGKVIVLFNFHPQPWTSSISSSSLSCCTHTARGGGEGGGAEEGPTGRNLGVLPRMRLSRATSGLHRQRKCKGKGGAGGRTGAEHGGDVSAPPGRHPARPSRGQREPQRERERRVAPPERRVTITTPHSGRVQAGRDATRAQAPRECPAANVSAASRGGPGAGLVWGRREPACERSSLLLCVLEAVAVQVRQPPAEQPTLRRGESPLSVLTPSLPRPSRKAATSARLDPGTGWH